jgi:hypothetical protein
MIQKLNIFYRSLTALFLGRRTALAYVKVSPALLVGLSLLYTSAATAGTIAYPGPDLGPGGMLGWMGNTVWYTGVEESNSATASRFGAPSGISGDSLDFDPQNFEATSAGGGSQITDSQLNFMVIAKDFSLIDNVQFSESGDTSLLAFAPDVAFTSVTASIFIDILEIDGAPVGGPLNVNGSMTFSPSDGDYQTGVDGSPAYNTIWTGSALFDMEAELATLGLVKGTDYVNGVTKVTVAVDNTLTAGTTGGASAFIRKKDFDGFTVTTNIPEPTTIILAALGLFTVVASRRRCLS